MKKQTNPNIKAHLLRGAFYLLLFVAVFVIVALSSAINLPNHPPKFPSPQNTTAFGVDGHGSVSPVAASTIRKNRTLTFADRVAYQRAIEDVYWRHRIWPKGNQRAKPSLDKVMSQATIENKVRDYLRNSQLLAQYWRKPITPEQLQAEMNRMASHTKQPEVLREIFAALGNDPYIIAECVARPALADRLARNLYAHDERFHGELRRRAEAELKAHRSVKQMKQASGMYTEMEWIKSDAAETGSALADTKSIQALKMNGSEWNESIEKLAGEFGNTKAALGTPRHSEAATADGVATALRRRGGGDQPDTDALAQIKTGVLNPLQEDEGQYYATAVISKGNHRLKLATVAWMKQPFDSWRAKAETQMPVTMAARITADYKLPAIGSPSTECTDDTWSPTSQSVPDARIHHTAVWTGSEMIVWGGQISSGPLVNTGGRYDPSTDTWTATSTTNAPDPRESHTAVWTGTRMIVWGGFVNGIGPVNTGGRYDPATDNWTATSLTNAPDPRQLHTAVWTGSDMIVWGGVAAPGT